MILSMRPYFLASFLAGVLLGAFLVPTSSAQITITKTDLEKILQRGHYGFSSMIAAPGEGARIQAVLDEVGPGGIFDFRQVQTVARFTEAEIQTPPFGPEVPSDPAFAKADFVNVVTVFESEPSYSFSLLNGAADAGPDGVYELGDVTEGLSTTTYSPPLRRFPFPMTYGTTWGSEESTVTESGLFTDTYTTSFSGEVVGYGTLIVPGGGRVEALVHQIVTMEADTVSARAVEFFGKDRLLSAVVLVDPEGSVLTYPLPDGTRQPAAFFQIGTEEGALAHLRSNTTGPVLEELPGGVVTFTDGSDTDGMLRGYRVGHPSSNNAIDDSGSPAGFPVTNVSPEGFWVVRAEGLSNFAYTICLDYGDLPGVSNPSQLAVLKREDAGTEWVPQPSTLDAGTQHICVQGLTSFSDFAIGGGTENPLPVELTVFAGDYDPGAKAVRLRWQTASEIGNAGFALERKSEAGGWSDIGFVDGAGTTSSTQSYQFTDKTLPFGAESLTYRLRQVDLDGTATRSTPVTVALGVPENARLHSIFPNPARQQATVRYELSEAGEVRLDMYDLLGRRVQSLDPKRIPAGRAEVQFDTSALPTGTYFVRFQTGEIVQTRPVVVVR